MLSAARRVALVRGSCARWIAVLCCVAVRASAQLPPPPVPPQNPITEPKRLLDKMLFWDEQLSSDNTVSCGTCHQPFRAGTGQRPAVHPGLDLSPGTPDDVIGSFRIARQYTNGALISDPVFGIDVHK